MRLGVRGQTGTTEMIIGGLVALILLYALASTIVTQSENAATSLDQDRFPDNDLDNSTYPNKTSQPLFRLGPLFWALVGIGVAAGIVVKTIRT